MRTLATITIVGCVAVLGCDEESMSPEAAAPVQTSAPPPPPPPPAKGDVFPTTELERVKAEVGVGKKGRDYGGTYITEVVKARFTAEQRIVFDIQIPKAMQLYEAANGRLPKSHDEFMREIIAANLITLPELPADERYVYDPELRELQVERPTPKEQP